MNTMESLSSRQAPQGPLLHDNPTRCRSCGQPRGHGDTDKLTGLLDRWGWEEAALHIWTGARQRHSSLALLFVDVDRFKRINDTAGHLAGDAVLQAVAAELRRATRDTDIVLGRYGGHGGDEFLVLLPATDLDGALAVADRIMHGIRSTIVPVKTRAHTTTTITDITVSIGIAVGEPGHNLKAFDDLILDADAALGEAKNRGRDQIHVEIDPRLRL